MELMLTDVEAEGGFALPFHSSSVKHASNFKLISINFIKWETMKNDILKIVAMMD